MQQDPPQYFCYLYIRSPAEAGIAIGWAILVICLLIKAYKNFRVAHKISVYSCQSIEIYVVITIWGLVYLTKIVMSEIVFFKYKDSESDLNQYLSKISKWVYLVDYGGAFTLQSILILVPYNIMFQTNKIFILLENTGDEQSNYQYEIRNKSRSISHSTVDADFQKEQDSKFAKCLRRLVIFYRILRGAVFITMCLLFLLNEQFRKQVVIALIIMSMVLQEIVMILMFMVYGLCMIIRSRKLKKIGCQKTLNQMKKRYIRLMACCGIRIIFLATFLVFYFIYVIKIQNGDQSHQTCKISIQQSWWKIFRVVDIIFQGLIMHCIPIYIALMQYKVDEDDSKLNDSLIIPEQSTQQQKLQSSLI